MDKLEIKVAIGLFESPGSIGDIAKHIQIDTGNCSKIITQLEKEGFCTKKRRFKEVLAVPSQTIHAQRFKELLIQRKGFKGMFKELLYGLNLNILLSALFDWKTTKDIAMQLGLSTKTIQNRMYPLKNRGLFSKHGRKFRFNNKNWPKLYAFLSAYRNFYPFGDVLWKFGDEVLFEVADKKDIKGVITGFTDYVNHKVPVGVIKYCCYMPKKGLSKEEVFIHSLLGIREDTRLLELAVVFYYKNRLNKKRLGILSKKYDCSNLLDDFFKIIKSKKEKIITDNLPHISRKGIQQMITKYKK